MKSQTAKFLETFRLKYPIIQAPMAGASTVELASTITSLGGLGSIPLGSASGNPGLISKQFEQFQSLVEDQSSKRSVNLNFFAHDVPEHNLFKEKQWVEKYKKYYQDNGLEWNQSLNELKLLYPTFKSITDINDATIVLLKALKPAIISFHFGLPKVTIVKQLQDSGLKVFVSITNLDEFKQVTSGDYSVDGVVLQGWEAGGHRGNFKANDPADEQLTTEALAKIVVEYIDSLNIQNAPFLVAAGGIHDSEGIRELLKLGVAAVQLGTVWLPTTQCTISKSHLELFKHPDGKGTLMSGAISGRNLRTIETEFLKELTESSEPETIPDYPLPYDIFKKLNGDAKKGGISKFSAYLAGSNYHQSWKGTTDVRSVFDQLVSDLSRDLP